MDTKFYVDEDDWFIWKVTGTIGKSQFFVKNAEVVMGYGILFARKIKLNHPALCDDLESAKKYAAEELKDDIEWMTEELDTKKSYLKELKT